jgi:Zn-dependent metalloprotease
VGRKFFGVLDQERNSAPAFALQGVEADVINTETVARRILDLALDAKTLPEFARPDVGDATSDFVSLGVETVPVTGTKFVKFRQHVNRIPVYGSLVAIEIDRQYKPVSLNSNFAAPKGCARLARISPLKASRAIARRAGYDDGDLPPVTPILNYYLDRKGKWHLAYILEHVRLRPPPPGKHAHQDHEIALAFDYVVDAITGKVVADLPRTVTMAELRESPDILGDNRTFGVAFDEKGIVVLRDPDLNIETYDGRYKDPRASGAKPLKGPCKEPWSPVAVSAHANASVVAEYLRTVLKRNGIDNRGGRIVSVVNCVAKSDPQGGKEWQNACWDGTRMLYGQVRNKGRLHSYASNVDIVAHELFHGLIGATARLEYEGQTGALNESYSDIFAILISNWKKRCTRDNWDWELGENIYQNCDAQRNFQDPDLHDQPKHMDNYRKMEDDKDKGGVHWNSGIHNFAAYNIMTAKGRDGDFLFGPEELAAIFYVALTQHLSRQARFSDSRRAVLLATRSYFRHLPRKSLDQRVKAVEDGFAAAGIA